MLPARRLFNLIYHWRVRNASAEQRAEVDDLLIDAGRLDLTEAPAAAGHVPGTAPSFRPPSWWKGNRAAFRSSVAAAQQLGEPAAMGEPGGRRPTPQIGNRRPTPATGV